MRGVLLAAALVVSVTAHAAPAGRENSAVTALNEVLKKNPNDRDARHRRAKLFVELKRLPEARADYEMLRKDASDELAAYQLAVVLSLQKDWTSLDEALRGIDDAVQKKKAGEYAKLWHNLGVVREEGGDVASARRAYTKSLALDPDRINTRLSLASVELANDDPESAEEQLAAITQTPEDLRRDLADLAAELAALRMKKGDLAKADELMARAEREAPQPPSFVVRFNRSLLLWHKGDIATARAQALELANGKLEKDDRGLVTALLWNIARSERLADDLVNAEADLRKALELSPDDGPTLLLLAKMELVAGKHADAAVHARHCFEVDPSQDECRIAYADAFVGAMKRLGPQADAAQAKGNLPEAIAIIERALAIDPEDEVLKERLRTLKSEQAEVGKLRGDLERKLSGKDWDGAMADLVELYRRVPDDPTLSTLEAAIQTGIIGDRLALQRRAEEAERAGKLYEAAEAWRKMSALDPNDDETASKAAAAEKAWKAGVAADREKAKGLSSKKQYAEARVLLLKWTDQGLKDAELKKQLDALDRIVLAQAQPLRAAAEKKLAEKKYPEAKNAFDDALKLDPKDKNAAEGKKRAEGHLDPALGAKLGRELYSQGVVLYSRGAYGEAIAKWSEILELPGAGEWQERAKSHIARAERILDMMKTPRR